MRAKRSSLLCTAGVMVVFWTSIAHAGPYTFQSFNGAGNNGGGTTANAISNNGSVVGFSSDGAGNLTNWIRNPDGSFNILSKLGPADMADGINNSNQVVGVTGTNAFSLLTPGGSPTLLPPANPGNTTAQLAFGVNDSGVIVGQYADSSKGFTPAVTGSLTASSPSPFLNRSPWFFWGWGSLVFSP